MSSCPSAAVIGQTDAQYTTVQLHNTFASLHTTTTRTIWIYQKPSSSRDRSAISRRCATKVNREVTVSIMNLRVPQAPIMYREDLLSPPVDLYLDHA